MNTAITNHIHRLPLSPVLDVLGQWAGLVNGRTGTCSMNRGILGKRQVVRERGWRIWEVIWDNWFEPRLDEVVLFTFVRNPWDRAVSAFHYLRDVDLKPKIPKEATFREYVSREVAGKWPDVNRHFRPQLPTFMFDGQLIPGVVIGRFERIEEDWAKIARLLNVNELLPHINASAHAHYTTYYDDMTRDIISRLYSEEIEYLEYEFGK
jgi:hypothetical protein